MSCLFQLHKIAVVCTVLLHCVQFDFVKLLDGKALPRSLTDPVSTAKAPKGLLLSGLQETGFIEYMDPGTWHLALYNDGRNLEQVLLHSTPIGEVDYYGFTRISFSLNAFHVCPSPVFLELYYVCIPVFVSIRVTSLSGPSLSTFICLYAQNMAQIGLKVTDICEELFLL